MKYLRKKLLVIIFITMILSGCKETPVRMGTLMEVTEYKQEIFKIEEPLDLNIELDKGNVEFYTWKNSEIKFEFTNQIKGYEDRKVLVNYFKNFKTNYRINGNHVTFSSIFRGGKVKNLWSKDMKLYIPQKISNINIKMEAGKLRFFDQIKCSLNMDLGKTAVEIDMFTGCLGLKSLKGNLYIGSGELYPGSSINLNYGNVDIKAALCKGDYRIKTSTGNITLSLPDSSKINLKTSGRNVENEFKKVEAITNLDLESDKGKIIVKKY